MDILPSSVTSSIEVPRAKFTLTLDNMNYLAGFDWVHDPEALEGDSWAYDPESPSGDSWAMNNRTDRSISLEKTKEYLDGIEDEKKRHVDKLTSDNTRYITFEELESRLEECIDKISIDKYNVMFPTTGDKIGSEHWLTLLSWNKLRNNCVKIINSYKGIDNDYPIIVIDDCIYSGWHMCETIDRTQYFHKKKTGGKLNNKFIVIVPYSSRTNSVGEYADKIIVGEYIDDYRSIKEIRELFPDDNELIEYMHQTFGLDGLSLPVYFDHKIASEISSFPMIYPNIIKNPVSREKIIELENMIKKYIKW